MDIPYLLIVATDLGKEPQNRIAWLGRTKERHKRYLEKIPYLIQDGTCLFP